MSTYAELRRDILITLDADPDATGDIYDLVNSCLKTVLLEIVSQANPAELLTQSATFDVDSTETPISISTDLLITDLLKPFALMVNEDPTNADSSAYAWKYINPKTHIKAANRLVGSTLPSKCFSRFGDTLLIYPWPTSPNEYEVSLWYYKQPATIVDSGVPELPIEYHSLLKYGVCKEFPHLFGGDRLPLFTLISNNYDKGMKRLLNDRLTGTEAIQLISSPTMAIGGYAKTGINWGGRQLP